MDFDFQEGFDVLEPCSDIQEPEWVQLNRQWTLDHPSVLLQKHPRPVFDGWAICDSPSDASLGWSVPYPSQESKSKKCFIDKIDIKSLVDDPDSFNIDNLFAETEDSSSETRIRRWEPSDERKVLRFVTSQAVFNMDMWKKIAKELGRSVNSVRIKAAQLKKVQERNGDEEKKTPLTAMISEAIRELPEQKGTKQEIIEKITGLQEKMKLKRWRESVSQMLSTHFVKVPGKYGLVEGTLVLEFKKNITMGDYIVWVLNKYGPMSRNEIKAKIYEHFGKTLNCNKAQGNLQTWEITFLKKLKSCKAIDSRAAKTTFKIS